MQPDRLTLRLTGGIMPDKPDEQARKGYIYDEPGNRVSLYIEPVVLSGIDSLAQAHQRSRSWMANRLLKLQLGQPDEEMIPK